MPIVCKDYIYLKMFLKIWNGKFNVFGYRFKLWLAYVSIRLHKYIFKKKSKPIKPQTGIYRAKITLLESVTQLSLKKIWEQSDLAKYYLIKIWFFFFTHTRRKSLHNPKASISRQKKNSKMYLFIN